ncbi:protein kinase [Horticoccus luteus]|uniref:Protein kinase n=1 Tax=Horticoccus luteus TaxID=2862869 RepID=A0A8F9TXP9_9BACT|nr:protein kinase [Horticoccus luteus]QYM79668.1 protein kinase [Horticoccus luteus]
MSNLASNLVGHDLNGWIVTKKISKFGGTGGAFSSAYLVQHKDGRDAFLKAINIGYAMNMFLPTGKRRNEILQDITENFEHEVDLLEACDTKRLDRVVVAIEEGEYRHPSDPYYIPFLIFELCKEGDVRRHPKMAAAGVTWPLRVFHEVCVGLKQLHSINIIHQDLKPSNVLIAAGTKAKIADLGRATVSGSRAMFSGANHWGDTDYMPIEFHYNHFEPDPTVRQKAADFYMLGGVLAFLVCKINIFSLILTKLPAAYHPMNWTGGFNAALPALHTATIDAVADIVASLPDVVKSDVREMILFLCHPEPLKRGHPKTVIQASGDRYSMERIVTTADRVANKARLIP